MTCRVIRAALISTALLASAARAQQPTARAFAVVAPTGDTLAAEQITRDAGGRRVEADLVVNAQHLRMHRVMTLTPDALVSRVDLTVHSPPDGPAVQSATVDFTRDSVLITMGAAAAPPQRFAVPAGALPFVNLSVASIEQILMRAKRVGGASADVPVFNLSGGQVATAKVQWIGADSATVTLTTVPLRVNVSPTGEFLGGIVPSQNLRFVRMSGNPLATPRAPSASSAPKPDYSAPPGAPYTAEEVRVHNAKANLDLAGTLTMPKHAPGARLPAVVMITGSGPEDRDEASVAIPGWRPFRQIADTLGRRGVAVLRLDDRGVGGTPVGPPGPTSADFADDIRAALAYLRTRGDIDPARLGLIGHSEGGMIAPMIAADDPSLHAIVIIAGPSRTGRAVSDEQVRTAFEARGLRGAALDTAIAQNNVAREAQLAKVPWLKYWFEYDPIPTAKRVKCPVLIVQGMTDQQVSPKQADELAAAIRSGGNSDVTVRLLPETNHLLVHDPNGSFEGYSKLPSLSVTPQVLGTIADWVAEKMRAR